MFECDVTQGSQDCKAVYDGVAGVQAGNVSFTTVLQPLLGVDADSCHRAQALRLPSKVATDKALRDASSDAKKMLNEFEVGMSMRKDLFDNILLFSKCEEAKSLSPELKRYLEKQVNSGMRIGLHFEEAKRDEIKAVKKRDRELALQLGRFWPKTRKVSGRSGMVEREAAIRPRRRPLGKPSGRLAHLHNHHHLLSLVAMATILAKYRHHCDLECKGSGMLTVNSYEYFK